MQAFQLEYRFPILKFFLMDLFKINYSLFQLAIFGELGQVQKKLSELSLTQYNISYGIGLRYNMVAPLEYYLSADIGFGRDEINILTYWGQNF